MLKIIYNFLKFLIYLGPLILLGYLIYLDFVPSGIISFSYDFSKDSPVITNLFPANRLTDPEPDLAGNFYQAIIKEPVYFETRLSQKFDQARVDLTFQNPNQLFFQLGLAVLGEGDWNYFFRPVDNKFINNLNWSRLEENNLILWQKNKKYDSLDGFLLNLDQEAKVGIYDYNLTRKFRLIDYQPLNDYQIFNKQLRGYHQFYTYLKNEDLDFTFKIQDINRAKGPDPWEINVYNEQNQKIYTKQIADDGYVTNLDPASDPLFTEIKIPKLPEGVYKIELKSEDEIFFREIKTKQKYLTFIDRVYLVDNPEYSDGFTDLKYQPTELSSTAKYLGFETTHPEGLQTVLINNQELTIGKTHQKYFFTAKTLPAALKIPKNDLKVFGRGLFSFSEEQYFNPEIYKLPDFQETPEINYLLTAYHEPVRAGEWWQSSIVFDLTNAEVNNRKIRWALSAPELNDLAATIKIKEIKITYYKEPTNLKNIAKEIYNYLIKFVK